LKWRAAQHRVCSLLLRFASPAFYYLACAPRTRFASGDRTTALKRSGWRRDMECDEAVATLHRAWFFSSMA